MFHLRSKVYMLSDIIKGFSVRPLSSTHSLTHSLPNITGHLQEPCAASADITGAEETLGRGNLMKRVHEQTVASFVVT